MISQVDAAITKVRPVGGICSAGDALSKCQTELFDGHSVNSNGNEVINVSRNQLGTLLKILVQNGWKKQVLVVILAGKSSDHVTSPAWLLAKSGVKTVAVGVNSYCNKPQATFLSDLTSIAITSSHVLCVTSLTNMTSVTKDVAHLVFDVLGLNIPEEGRLRMHSGVRTHYLHFLL